MEPWSRVHMDHAYMPAVGLLLIKQILRVIFSRNSIPKPLVSVNAPERCDEDLSLWWEK